MGSVGITTARAGFRDGDTASVLQDKVLYRITRENRNGSSRDYGTMTGADAKIMLKDYQYEELVPGDGMWLRKGGRASFAYYVEEVR